MEKIKIGNLDSLFLNNNAKKAIVVLHGYGASMDDLAPLHQVIEMPEDTDWYFLNGVESVDFGPYMPPGKAWFPIDMVALQSGDPSERMEAYFKERPAGFVKATDEVKNSLSILQSKYVSITLGGFSQGSMICCDVAFEFGDWIKKLVLLSSTFVDKDHLDQQIIKNKDVNIFQSHGVSDSVLPFSQAEKLANYFKENFSTSEFYPFQGGHEIPMDVIASLNKFLAK